MEIGYQIADFTWKGGPAKLGETLARQAHDAEAAGATRVSVMDHFWQIRGVGPVEHEMLEAYVALGFIAAHTQRALLHVLVTGVTYREPALLAKQISTLDVLSGGRAGLGIGAAWNKEESEGLGFPFPPTSERFERLDEAIRICLQLWSDSEAPFHGQHYQLDRTLNVPRPLQERPYLMIGGGGERKTLRMVAQYADACNLGAKADVEHKLEVLRRHCDDLGRDYDTIEKTTLIALEPDDNADDLVREAERMRSAGFSVAYVFAHGITEPARAIDVVAEAIPRLA